MIDNLERRQHIWCQLCFSVMLAWIVLSSLDSYLYGEPAPCPLRDLIRDLQDKDESIRAKAAASLEKRGREAASAVPHLIRALEEDNKPKVRGAAAGALDRIQGKKALPAIVKSLKIEKDPDVRFILVTIVMQWGRDRGPEVKEIIPPLIETMKLDYEKYTNAVESAWVSLIIIGPEAVPALVGLANDKGQEVIKRSTAIYVLGRMGKEANKAAPTLIELLRDPADDLASEAARAIGSIGARGKDVIQALEAFGKRASSMQSRIDAVAALARIDPDNKNLSSFIHTILKDGNSSERARGANLAWRLGPRARATVLDLVSLLDDPKEMTRVAAVDALGAIAPEDKAVIAALKKASRDPSSLVRKKALTVMKQIESNRRE
jgi:HEAT repeat protein